MMMPRGLLSPEERQYAMFQGLLNAGPMLMAAGAPSTNPGGNMGLLGGLGQAFSQPQQQMVQNKFMGLEYEDMMRQREQEEARAGLLAQATEGLDPKLAAWAQAYPEEYAQRYLESTFATEDPLRVDSGSDLVEVLGPDGDPILLPAWEAAGMTPYRDVDDPQVSAQARLWADEQAGRVPKGTFESVYGSGSGSAPTPYSDIAKLTVDFRNGYLTLDEYERQKLEQLRQDGAPNAEDFDSADKLRDELNALSKDFLSARDAYSRVVASEQDPSPAGDLALIFNYMKVLDPGSVVRESEFATAAASGSYGERIQAAVNRVTSGERLSGEMRADFFDRAQRLYRAQEENYLRTADSYRTLATQFGIDPSLVIMDYALPSGDAETPTGIPEGATQIGTLPNGTPVWEDAEGNRWVEE